MYVWRKMASPGAANMSLWKFIPAHIELSMQCEVQMNQLPGAALMRCAKQEVAMAWGAPIIWCAQRGALLAAHAAARRWLRGHSS